MRIGIFSDSYPPYVSGLVTSELMLIKGLEELGHQVYVVTVNYDNLKFDFDEKSKVIRIPGVPVGIYDARLTGIYPLKAISIIKKWNLDVIHTQTEFGVGTFARIIAKQFNIPLVHTYHTMYEDYVHYITKGYFNGPSKKIVEYLTKFYCDKTTTELIVPTKKAADLFKEKYMVDRDVHIIPTGFELSRFYKEKVDSKTIKEYLDKFGIKKDDFTILFVGRLAEEKNVEFLLESHKKLITKNKKLKLLIVGDGPGKEQYEEYVHNNEMDNNVIFTGKVPWDSIPIYYAISDIFVTASKTETQGLTVIEAIASSLPVVCINDESFIDTIKNGLNGRIFKDEKEYIQIVNWLFNNPEELKKLSEQARKSSERHNNKHFAESVLKVYKLAIKNNPKSRIPLLEKMKNFMKKGKK